VVLQFFQQPKGVHPHRVCLCVGCYLSLRSNGTPWASWGVIWAFNFPCAVSVSTPQTLTLNPESMILNPESYTTNPKPQP